MSKQPSPRTRTGAARGWLRLMVYIAVVGALSVGWLVHQARAELGRKALGFGRELSLTTNARTLAGTTTVRVNGQEASINSSVVEASVDTVLDRFTKGCAEQSGGMREEVRSAIAKGAKLPDPDTFGVFRTERGQREATAACFARGERKGIEALVEDLGRAVDTGDLGALGELRYVYARVASDGKQTHVLTGWTHGALRLDEMFPAHGDATGPDLVEGARPKDATRTLSAESADDRYRVVLYETPNEVEPALAEYGRALGAAGYESALTPEITAAFPVPVRVYRRGARDEIVVLAERSGERTLIAGLRPGMNGFVRLEVP